MKEISFGILVEKGSTVFFAKTAQENPSYDKIKKLVTALKHETKQFHFELNGDSHGDHEVRRLVNEKKDGDIYHSSSNTIGVEIPYNLIPEKYKTRST